MVKFLYSRNYEELCAKVEEFTENVNATSIEIIPKPKRERVYAFNIYYTV